MLRLAKQKKLVRLYTKSLRGMTPKDKTNLVKEWMHEGMSHARLLKHVAEAWACGDWSGQFEGHFKWRGTQGLFTWAGGWGLLDKQQILGDQCLRWRRWLPF